MAEMMVSVVLDQLATLLVEEVGTKVKMAVHIEEDIKKLETTLKTIQAVLHDAEKKQVQNQGVKLWLESLKEVVYEIEDAVDNWNTKLLRSQIRTQFKDKKVYSYLLNPFFSFKNSVLLQNNLGREIKSLREKLGSIASDKDNYGLAYGMTTDVSQPPPREKTSSLVNVSEVYGRDADRDIIVSKLLSESSHNDQVGVPIISIVGMGGLGKTTLAQLILHDKNVVKHFGKTMWVCVSEPFDKTSLAKAIIKAFGGQVPTDCEWNTLHCLLSEIVKDKLFMIVLDDVWTEDPNQWEPFKLCLDGGAPGSRILLITRSGRVALMMNSTYIHTLGGLTDENSWSLFCSATHMSMEDKDYEMFEEIGKAITKKCNGVPLAIKTVGSLLRFKRNIQDWQEVLESVTWKLQGFVKGVLPALLLIYYDLPSSWKPCFTYCAIFPKDYILEKDELIKLWMAHGFLYSTQNKEMEKVGEEYFDGIVSRSLFQDVKTDESGNIRSCKMHDLVHDFLQFLTKNETLIVERNDRNVNSSKLRHLNAQNLDDTRAILSSIHNTSLRSLNLKFQGLDGKIFRLWTCLRSLDLSDSVISTLPDEIGELIHLRYLDLSRTWVEKLPNSLSNLCNLQTLKLNECRYLCELPASMGNMISLRHLEIYKTYTLSSLPEGIERLTSLRSLSKFIVSEGRNLGDLKGLNLIHGSIEISGLWRVKSAYDAKEVHLANKPGIHALTLDFASHVISFLDINEYRGRMEGVLEGLQPHPNLEELKINKYPGTKLPSWMILFSELRTLELINLRQCTTLPSLGRLPLLEVLRIEGMISVRRLGLDFLGISDIEEEDAAATKGVFPNLIELELSGMSELEEWVLPFERSDTLQIMPRLRILRIEWSPKLKVLPALGRLESLEELTINQLYSLKRIGPERMEGVLEGLQPHPNLEELKINGYPGSKLPSWMILFSKLRTLELMDLSQCTTLPSLGRLPLLEVLKIEGMISVRRLGLDFLGISDIEEEDDDATSSINREKLVVFPKLIHLELKGMIMLEEWVLPFERSDKLQIMPRLRKLHIGRSYILKVLPALGRLESLEELTIDGLHSLKRIGPEFFGISDEDIVKGTSGSSSTESVPIIVFPKLKKLKFSWMKEWEEWEMMMPSWREDVSFVMPYLKELRLDTCNKLKVVPHNIFSYQTVEEKIIDCLELNQRSGSNQIIRRKEVGKSTGNMALFRRLFNRKPSNQLLEISERVYVFDSCFSTNILEEGEFKSYMDGIVVQLQDYFPDSSFMVFNFREGERRSEISDLLSEHNITVMDYPTQYEGCPVLPLEMINHFLKSSEGWLSLERQQNVLLMHCERGGWPILAFMLAGLLLYRKQYTGELKTLEMVYKQAPTELLHLLSPLNPKPSQLRYLQYISRRNLDSDWPPSDTPLTLDNLILRFLPLINGERSYMLIVRVYGQDPSAVASRSSKILFSTPKTKKHVRRYTKAEEHTSMQKIDISCLVQGDVVLECIHLDDDLILEEMMFRIMFNTSLIQSNVLMLGREEIDVLWDYKDQLPKEFKAEVLFSDFNAINEDEDQLAGEEIDVLWDNKDQLPKEFKAEVLFSDFNAINEDEEEFFEVEEIFSNVDGKVDSDGKEIFCYEDLKMATNNFQDKLGSGGSASVFKGVLKDGTQVAVKRVLHVTLGEQMLKRFYDAEVSALANVKHVHLVTLRGYCIHMTEMGRFFYIVYDLLPNGSLDDWILSRTGGPTGRYLSWKSRYRIAVDVAEALAYLHHDCSPQILHLDVKPDNILLDNNFRGVLSDFGLSRLMQSDVGTVFSTIRGTPGYIAPGWNYGISIKCDIYSYGKVLLDIFFGKRYVCLNQEGIDIYKRHSEGGNSEREQRIFHAFMWKRLRQCQIMDLFDKRLVENERVDEREAICLVYAALSCLQDEPELRPHDMREVIGILNQKIQKGTELSRLLELGSTT